jgi:lipooligosaccharide transport system permease protein
MLFRILLSSAAFLLVAAAFGTLHSGWAPAALLVAGLVGLAVAGPTIAYSATVSSDSYLSILMRFGVLPMSLFSGVFFPVESLPTFLRWVAYAFPLSHAVDLSRAATLGLHVGWAALWHVAYLLVWVAGGSLLAYRRFRRRLVI